ncbi:bacteriocin-like protein [Chryseobacterium aquaticum]|uniref:bacteriocin-like protein n=1 Tax=Chryseobacterium aquaticum TaxID=452084 RepID=UPI0039F5EFAD
MKSLKKLKRKELKNVTGGGSCFCLVSPDPCYDLNVNNEGRPYVYNCCTSSCQQL